MQNLPVALITGASRGLGAYFALHLAENGYAVVVHYYRSKQVAEKIVSQLTEQGKPALALQGDVTSSSDAQRIVQEVISQWGHLNVLINNAAIYYGQTPQATQPHEWNQEINVAASGTFWMCHHSLPYLRRVKHGRIINIGDSGCDRLDARHLSLGYHLGKTGVYLLTRSLAKQEAPHGITINMISPGILENSTHKPPIEDIPARRYGTFSEVCHAANFLLHPNSSYITGTNIVVSGGWNL